MSRERRRLKAERDAHVAAIDAADLDHDALAAICRLSGMASTEDGGAPVVEPLDDAADFMDFDAAVCRAGLTVFIRPRMANDWPAVAGFPTGATHALVRQIAPGIRLRLPFYYMPYSALN